jgi:hypothetical protein
MIFASVQFVLSQLPNFDSISTISLAAAIMSIWLVSVHPHDRINLLCCTAKNLKTADMTATRRLLGELPWTRDGRRRGL